MSPEDNLSGDTLAAFNRYMTTVSQYMRRGHNYSDMAVYMPLEDSWMHVFYPDKVREQMKWVWGQYEMRFIDTPREFKGIQPLWVNEHFLSQARYADGRLHCGQADFRSLYVGVEYMELGALRHILRLAREGLPVYMATQPKEPGRVKHPADYAAAMQELLALDNVGTHAAVITHKPLLEGDSLPDFWCRQEGDTYYIFVANPMTQTISYPLDYCHAFTDQGSQRAVTVHHHGKSEPYTLRFRPQESLLLRVTPDGITLIDLGFTPTVMRKG